MKKISVILLFTLNLFSSEPDWFYNISHKDFEIIGYGVGQTRKEAKQNARIEITNSISVQVQNSFFRENSLENGKYRKDIQQNSSEKSFAKLDNLEIMKSEYLGDRYFVAIKYLNISFIKNLKYRIGDRKIAKENNRYLQKTLFLQELKQEFGFYPKIEIYRDILTIGDFSFKISQEILGKLLISVDNQNLNLTIPKKLKNGELYFIQVQVKKKGFLTLIQIYKNGETSLLFANKIVSKNMILEYPNSENFDGIETYLANGTLKTQDLTMAVLCQEKRGFEYFDSISIEKEQFAKIYGDLFNLISGCDVVSGVLEIRR